MSIRKILQAKKQKNEETKILNKHGIDIKYEEKWRKRKLDYYYEIWNKEKQTQHDSFYHDFITKEVTNFISKSDFLSGRLSLNFQTPDPQWLNEPDFLLIDRLGAHRSPPLKHFFIDAQIPVIYLPKHSKHIYRKQLSSQQRILKIKRPLLLL